MRSTARDLLAFSQALFGNRLLSAESLRALTAPQVDLGGGRGYGRGFMIDQTRLGPCIGHTGGVLGYSACFAHYAHSGHTVIVLANMDAVATAQAAVIGELLPAPRETGR